MSFGATGLPKNYVPFVDQTGVQDSCLRDSARAGRLIPQRKNKGARNFCCRVACEVCLPTLLLEVLDEGLDGDAPFRGRTLTAAII